MSVKIRLKRMGARKRPAYRVVVMDSRSPRDGRPIEEIGYYSAVLPSKDQVRIAKDRVEYWMRNGAQMSDTVKRLYKKTYIPMAPSDTEDTPVENS